MLVTRKSHHVIFTYNISLRTWLEGDNKYVGLRKMWILMNLWLEPYEWTWFSNLHYVSFIRSMSNNWWILGLNLS
jgi:hypothetical protein